MAHPGTLPVINKEAVRCVLMLGAAINGKFATYSEFDRKNYFYPDLPKGYQISQYAYPLVSGGSLRGVDITRIHLEEDTASSVHDDATNETLVDYNRAGVPLMELVTEPVMHSARDAAEFGRELQLLLRYLGISDADMEMGEMRVEANVSVAEEGQRASAYVEIKNINSFKVMEAAVEYEIKRQTKLIEQGGVVTKQTLGWNESKQETFNQRSKEGAADYRYFPDPDIPSLQLNEVAELALEKIQQALPELPEDRRRRYSALGIKAEDAEQYVRSPQFGNYFDKVVEVGQFNSRQVQIASNYIANDLTSAIRDTEKRDTENQDGVNITPENFAMLIQMIDRKELSSHAAKQILVAMLTSQMDPYALALKDDLLQKSSAEDLLPIVEAVLKEHRSVADEYRSGKEASLKFLIGQAMRLSKGAGNPEMLRELIVSNINTK